MESLIRRRLASEIGELVAAYGSDVAIFYQKAPADTDAEENYPRVVFSVDKFSDVQKGVAGLLSVDIMSTQLNLPPEEIERPLRGCLEGVFFKPEGGEIFALKWQRSDIFTEPASERTPLLIGVTMSFEIYEYPRVQTVAPSPVEGLSNFAAQLGLKVIALSPMDELFIPTRFEPAVYFDMQRERLLEQLNSAVYLEAMINLHVFAPDVHTRRQWLARLNGEILLRGTIFLNDGSPMLLRGMEYLYSASEVQGQIQYTFRYGLPAKFPYAHPLNNIHLSKGDSRCTR